MTDHAESDGHEHGLPPKSTVRRWLVTTNHKDIGSLYLVTALFFLIAGGLLAMLLRMQLWSPGGTILGGQGYNQTVTSHGLLMVFWFISPFAFGLANYLVPLQIGAKDLAFPRLNALSYWLYLASGLLFLSSFFLGTTFSGGWTMYAPLNLPAFTPEVGQVGSLAAIFALMMFVTSVTIGSVNFLTTFYRMRAEGLRMRDIPLFSMSILLTVWMMLFAFAALLAATILLGLDHVLGTVWFGTTEGSSLLWAHLFWFFGHPEVYIVFFPALGVMAEVFQTFSGKRLVGRKWFVIAMALVAIQSFVVWMHHMFLTAINLPTKTVFMATTIGISLPFDLMVFALIYTLVKGKVRFKTPFLFSFGALLLFILGGITGVFLGAVVLDLQFRGTYWVVAHFHYVMFGGGTALIGGLYYWYPKITGKMYNEFLGKLHFGVFFIGFNLLYFPMFVVWETPRRVFDYAEAFTTWHRVATIGAFLFAASFLIMLYNMFDSFYTGEDAPDNPWEYGSSAEWSVSSPPPLENFPGVASYAGGKLSFLTRDTAADGGTVVEREPAAGAEQTAPDGGAIAHAGASALSRTTDYESELAVEEEHADHASIWPVAVSVGAFFTFLGLAGISKAYFIWPFVFGAALFVAYLGFEGARREEFGLIHPVMVTLGAVIAGGGLVLLSIDKGSLQAAIEGASPYAYVTMLGTAIGSVTLIRLGWESFHVPEPALAEQWPFTKIKNVKLGMWIFLGSDVILFGALIGAYIFMRVSQGWLAWEHTLVPEEHVVLPGLINTYLLLISSFAVVLALVAARRQNRRKLLAYLSLTFTLGVGFLINKATEWIHLFNLHGGAFEGGWTFTTNIASSSFYVTTGLHGAHVAVGLLITLYLLVRAYNGAYLGEENAETVENFGLYWHFVDIVWLFLFPLYYIL
jgi:cytochrome c oxidase subunit I+III